MRGLCARFFGICGLSRKVGLRVSGNWACLSVPLDPITTPVPPTGASEAEPLVLGKPSSFLLDAICRAAGLSKQDLCVVGDRLDTDVLWGNQNGCGTLLVLSGATSEADLRDPRNKVYPMSYVDSIADMLLVKDKLSSCVVS
jgi:hypothetical protein